MKAKSTKSQKPLLVLDPEDSDPRLLFSTTPAEIALTHAPRAPVTRRKDDLAERLVEQIVESFDHAGLLPIGGHYTWAAGDAPIAGCAVGALQLDGCAHILDEMGVDHSCVEAGFDAQYTSGKAEPRCPNCERFSCVGYRAGAAACAAIEDKLYAGLGEEERS